MSADMLVCCGSLTLDNVLTADGRILPQAWGGNVLYSALAARLWHDRVGVLSRVGNDYPAGAAQALAERGIDVGGLVAVDRPHGMNVAFSYRPDGSRVRAFPPEAMDRIPISERARFVDYTTHGTSHRFATWLGFAPDGQDFPEAWKTRAAGVHCAAMPVQRHLAIATALREARGAAPWIQVDSPWYDERDLTQDCATPLFRLIDALLPSEADIDIVAGPRGPGSCLSALFAAGLSRLIVKRGAAGCTIHRAGSHQAIALPSHPSDFVDLTGAGDAFCGGFLAGIVQTGDPVAAAEYGTVSASLTIEGLGLNGLLRATPQDAAARLAQYRTRRAVTTNTR